MLLFMQCGSLFSGVFFVGCDVHCVGVVAVIVFSVFVVDDFA